jgi:hypothetical protein
MTPTPSTGTRALARLYDQQLRQHAVHYSNMWEGRANSAKLVADYFHKLVDLVGPALFVEAGAYGADASHRVRRDHPECRVVAFEANPFNYEQFSAAYGFDDQGIDTSRRPSIGKDSGDR